METRITSRQILLWRGPGIVGTLGVVWSGGLVLNRMIVDHTMAACSSVKMVNLSMSNSTAPVSPDRGTVVLD